jgi:hypothetical protein
MKLFVLFILIFMNGCAARYESGERVHPEIPKCFSQEGQGQFYKVCCTEDIAGVAHCQIY